MTIEAKEMESAVEGILFAAGEPVDIKRICMALDADRSVVEQVLQRRGCTMADVDCFVFHQANARITDLVARKLGIPPEKYYKNIDRYGNTSAGSIPLVLSELHEMGRVGPGSRVLAVGFGGGLTWGGALLEFGERRPL